MSPVHFEEKHKDGRSFHCHVSERHEAGVMANAHYHDYIELLYTVQGDFVCRLSDNKYHFSQGDLVIINRRETHQIEMKGNGFGKYIVIKFEPEAIFPSFNSAFELQYVFPFILSQSTHQRVFKKEQICGTVVPELITQIFDEWEEKEYGFELLVRANLLRVFLWILRMWHGQGVDLRVTDRHKSDVILRLRRALEYINENYGDNIKATDMARLCNMSYSYFSRLFKEVMKKSFKEYLNSVRITNAERLLVTSTMNITEIAQETGFSTASYFIQQFKKHKNSSPKRFQANFTMNR